MSQYFAAVLVRGDDGWSGREIDMDSIEDLDGLVDVLRDAADGGQALFFLEEDDEYLAMVRVDGDAEPRTFITDDRAVATYPFARIVMEEVAVSAEDEDEEEGIRPEAEAVGDLSIVSDLGTSAEHLMELCAEEGMLPADIITEICEKAGCADVLDDVRGS